MATYLWTGAVSGDITNSANWAGGEVPVGHGSTRIYIGHFAAYPDHVITNWPDGGHFDMQADTILITPSWGLQEGVTTSTPITIGSDTDYLKISRTTYVIVGSGEGESTDDFSSPAGSKLYIHMEQWDDGYDSTFTINNLKTATGTHSPHTPSTDLFLKGNPHHLTTQGAGNFGIQGLNIVWDTAHLNIEGSTPSQSENGPQTSINLGPNFPTSRDYLINTNVTLDWQDSTNGGNPVKQCRIGVTSGTVNIIANNYAYGTTHGLEVLDSRKEPAEHVGDDYGNKVYIRSTETLGGETTPVTIPALSLITGNDTAYANEGRTVTHIQTGMTVGGADPGYTEGLSIHGHDVIFTEHVATAVTIKSGTIYNKSRIDASNLSPSNFKMMDEYTGTGVFIAENPSGWNSGWAPKFRLPLYSNIRIV